MIIEQDYQTVQKTPAGVWDITINWGCPTRDLGDDLIATSSWAVTGPDNSLVLFDEEILTGDKKTLIWIEGGTVGGYYQVTNTITTQGGRTLTGTFVVQVVEYLYLTQPRCI